MASTRKSISSSSNSAPLLVNEYTQITQEISSRLTLLQEHAAMLKKSSGQYLLEVGSEKKSGLSAQIVALNQEIDKEINAVLASIQMLAKDNQKAAISKPDEMEYRTSLHKSVTADFIKIVELIARTQLDSQTKQKTLVSHMFAAYKPAISENPEQITSSAELINMIQTAMVKSDQAHQAYGYVKKKHEGIQKIEHGLIELRGLALQLAILVEAQAEQINLLNVNIGQIKSTIKDGKTELENTKRFGPN
ncbi:MAG: hypothetical protein WAW86_00100 [Gammaproteobacteria bacterium]